MLSEKKQSEFRSAFTLIELLVVIAIISLLVSILVPSLQKAKTLTRTVVCQTQLRNIGGGVAFYSNDFNEFILPADIMLTAADYPSGQFNLYNRWYDWLRVKYLDGPVDNYGIPFDPTFVTTCPEEDQEMSIRAGYGMNAFAPGASGYWAAIGTNNPYLRFDQVVTNLGDSVYVTDTTNPGSGTFGNLHKCHPDYAAEWWGTPAKRHADSFNVLFLDLHVENAKWPDQIRDSSHRWNLSGISGYGI